MEKVSINPPLYFLINSLRGIGYSLETAIADLIDNSIAAYASKINVNFVWNEGVPYITIIDNGIGMSDAELVSALNLAEKGVDYKRNPSDLGRFGLGLKTASFSQCKIVSVISKQNGLISSYRWDLNILKETPDNTLFLLRGPHNSELPEVKNMDSVEHGTTVIWQDLDRVISRNTTFDQFCYLSNKVASHLSMVFHRFLQRKSIEIVVDGIKIKPWNPFPESAPTIRFPQITLGEKKHITASGFVLPHKDYFPSEDLYIQAGGGAGWISQQGFYIYRNDRLLVSGSWLGLGRPKPWTKDELHILARIQVNITSDDDFDWAIDVKKSTASPPADVRYRLESLGTHIRAEARKVYVFRGKGSPYSKRKFEFAWIKENNRYRINKNHSIISKIMETMRDYKKDFDLLLRIIEESVPVERIWLDTAEQQAPTTQYNNNEVDNLILPSIQEAFDVLLSDGKYTIAKAQEILNEVEPFNLYPNAILKVAKMKKKEFEK